jgi:hypothetical protein
MRKWIVAIALVAAAYSAHEVYAQIQLRQLMANKLETAQKLLAAIAVADFDKIARQADHLSSIANQAEWVAFKTPKYELHSNEFRRAAETMSRKAKDKNIDGVTLAYMDMTMSCVRCHQHVREIRDARLPTPPAPVALAPQSAR